MTNFEMTFVVPLFFCILGAALSRIEDIILFFKYFNSPPKYLTRNWHTYHYTRDEEGTPFVRYELWMIKQTRTGRYKIKTSDPKRPFLIYSGYLRSEGHNTLIELHQQEQDETVFVRIKKPLGGNLDRIYGLYNAIDFIHREYCSVVLMSGEEINDESVVIEKLKNHVNFQSLPAGFMLAET